jgi:hypothetical protein
MIAQQPNNAQPNLTPGPVTRGSTLPNTMETGGFLVCPRLDWIRATGPESLSEPLTSWLESMNLDPLSGEPEPFEQSRGHFGYQHGRFWQDKGAKVMWGAAGPHPTTMIELTGSFLSRTSIEDQAEMIAQLIDLGVNKFTRLDLALDYFTDETPSELITFHMDALASCEAGDLVSPRTFYPIHPKTNKLESQGFTLYLGSNKSDAFSRIYDKGQQTGNRPPGTWIRWELETKDTKATQIALRLASVQSTELASLVQGLVLASATFDPEPEWFKALKHDVELVPVSPIRDDTSWQGFKDHARRMLGNRLSELAHQYGVPVSKVCQVLFGELEPAPPRRVDDVLRGAASDLA